MATLTRGKSPQMCTFRSTMLHNAKHCQESLGRGFALSAHRNTLARKHPRVFRTTAPLHTLTADIWEQSQTSPNQVTQITPQVLPSRELEQSAICHSLGESLSKKSDPFYLATLAMERTKEQLGNHLQIFTDGSVLESGEVGCAFVIQDLKIIRRYRLPTGTSIFTAEPDAILMACSTANDLLNPPPPPPPPTLPPWSSNPVRLQIGTTGPRKGRLKKRNEGNCKLRSSSLLIS